MVSLGFKVLVSDPARSCAHVTGFQALLVAVFASTLILQGLLSGRLSFKPREYIDTPAAKGFHWPPDQPQRKPGI